MADYSNLALVVGNSNYEGLPHEVQWYTGYMDNFMIFNRGLSQIDIDRLYTLYS